MKSVQEILLEWASRLAVAHENLPRRTVRVSSGRVAWLFSLGGGKNSATDLSETERAVDSNCSVAIPPDVLAEIGAGTLNPQGAFVEGRVRISGDGGAALRMSSLLE
jgi:putative sterol carrier protein